MIFKIDYLQNVGAVAGIRTRVSCVAGRYPTRLDYNRVHPEMLGACINLLPWLLHEKWKQKKSR